MPDHSPLPWSRNYSAETAGIDDANGNPIVDAVEFADAELILRAVNSYRKLTDALRESVKLQSHYASLLNQYDGGLRHSFASVEEWVERLRECRKETS